MKTNEKIAGVIILGIYTILTGYRLREVPGEWYSDVSILHIEVIDILKNPFDWKFYMSAGPLYPHLVAGLASVSGARFETYKIASVLTGIAILILTFLLGQELINKRVGIIASCIGAVSFWLLAWARAGSSPQIFTPVMSTLAVWLMVLLKKKRRIRYGVGAGVVAGLGFFVYPALFILPALVLLIGFIDLWRSNDRRWWGRALLLITLTILPLGLGFAAMTMRQEAFETGGYVSAKLFQPGVSVAGQLELAGRNYLKTLGMFHLGGDLAFRNNVTGKPILDPVSGVLLLIGMVWLLTNQRLRKEWPYILLPVFVLIVPATMPGILAVEIPSTGRTFSITPFIFLLIALGLEFLVSFGLKALIKATSCLGRLSHLSVFRAVLRRDDKTLTRVATLFGQISMILLLGVIGILNVTKYFGDYVWGLPNHNQPWGWLIAQYIDALPQETIVQMTDCCWGEWEQPSPQGIYYVLKRQLGRENILTGKPFLSQCKSLQAGKNYTLIMKPSDLGLIDHFKKCFPQAEGEIHYDKLNQPAFYALEINLSVR